MHGEGISVADALSFLKRIGVDIQFLLEPVSWRGVQDLSDWYLASNIGWTILFASLAITFSWFALEDRLLRLTDFIRHAAARRIKSCSLGVMNWQRLRSPSAIVAFGFAIALAVGVVLAYFRAQQPTLEESCLKECAAKQKFGRVVGKYPAHMLPSTRNPQICECY